MTFRRCFTLAALLGALMVGTNTAHANFSFTSTTSPATTTFGGSTVTFSTGSGSLINGSSSANLANISDTSTTTSPSTDTTTIAYSITVTIVNNPSSGGTGPGTNGTGTVTVTGTETVTVNSTSFNGTNSFGATPSNITIGGVVYSFTNLSFTQPNPAAPPGNLGSIGMTITPTVPGVPEPASVVMLGSGLIGVLGLGWRRRIRRKPDASPPLAG